MLWGRSRRMFDVVLRMKRGGEGESAGEQEDHPLVCVRMGACMRAYNYSYITIVS